jgi:peptide/nickel transport system permease protein
VISRILEALLCFPTLLLLVVLLAVAPPWLLGLPDATRIALVLGATGWIPIARFLRAEFRKLRSSEMVLAATASGLPPLSIALRHLLPSALAPVLVTAAFTVGGAIVAEAALSFLGLGLRPPAASWGGLLTEGREQIESAWWLVLFPGASLFLTVLACNLVGEGLRDYLDPRTS